MRKLSIFIFVAITSICAWAQKSPDGLTLVEGGAFKNTKSNYYGKRPPSPFTGNSILIVSFYIGRYEVTQKEWVDVMGSNPSKFKGDDLPVENVSWYDCIEYCNLRSTKEGLKPYYTIDKNKKDPNNGNDIDDIKWTVTMSSDASGYRLPTEAEWEYAAGGGQSSKSFTFSGSDDVDKVGWYFKNSGEKQLTGLWSWPVIEQNHNKTKPVGSRDSNELGLYDMSGNVREWCWDWYGESVGYGTGPKGSSRETGRVWKGGGWLGGDFCCATSFRASLEANGKGPDQGFRLCRNQ